MTDKAKYWKGYAKKKSCRWCFHLIWKNNMQVKCIVDGKERWSRIVDDVFMLSRKGNSRFWEMAKDCEYFEGEADEKFQ